MRSGGIRVPARAGAFGRESRAPLRCRGRSARERSHSRPLRPRRRGGAPDPREGGPPGERRPGEAGEARREVRPGSCTFSHGRTWQEKVDEGFGLSSSLPAPSPRPVPSPSSVAPDASGPAPDRRPPASGEARTLVPSLDQRRTMVGARSPGGRLVVDRRSDRIEVSGTGLPAIRLPSPGRGPGRHRRRARHRPRCGTLVRGGAVRFPSRARTVAIGRRQAAQPVLGGRPGIRTQNLRIKSPLLYR